MDSITMNQTASTSFSAPASARAVRGAVAAGAKALTLKPVRRELPAPPAMPADAADELQAVRDALAGGPGALCPRDRAMNLVVDQLLGALYDGSAAAAGGTPQAARSEHDATEVPNESTAETLSRLCLRFPEAPAPDGRKNV